MSINPFGQGRFGQSYPVLSRRNIGEIIGAINTVRSLHPFAPQIFQQLTLQDLQIARTRALQTPSSLQATQQALWLHRLMFAPNVDASTRKYLVQQWNAIGNQLNQSPASQIDKLIALYPTLDALDGVRGNGFTQGQVAEKQHYLVGDENRYIGPDYDPYRNYRPLNGFGLPEAKAVNINFGPPSNFPPIQNPLLYGLGE